MASKWRRVALCIRAIDDFLISPVNRHHSPLQYTLVASRPCEPDHKQEIVMTEHSKTQNLQDAHIAVVADVEGNTGH